MCYYKLKICNNKIYNLIFQKLLKFFSKKFQIRTFYVIFQLDLDFEFDEIFFFHTE